MAVVYRFIAPDGRSYVGAVRDGRNRAKHGIARTNQRLEEAFRQYPPETFRSEILEEVPGWPSRDELAKAEQRHINRLRSWDPKYGFNMCVWKHCTYYQCLTLHVALDAERPRKQAAAHTQAEATGARERPFSFSQSGNFTNSGWRRGKHNKEPFS